MNRIIVGDFMYNKVVLKYNSLEPYIDDKTLDLHYNKHYQKYLDNLNKVLKSNNYDYQYSLKDCSLFFHKKLPYNHLGQSIKS